MPLPRLSYLYERTSEWPQNRVGYFLRMLPFIFLVLGGLVEWLADIDWASTAGGAICIAFVYPCLWAEVKLKDRQQANSSPQDAPQL